ncbi:class I tRNA ligase family protein [Blattabacterium cuenoti]|uniref:class I tRNA ligase family protein n=1 Tax=Blattabacterium cuenoti TaxID=1653831 RepID=UPI00163CC7CD|nr:class I tRNA ligase family protein [Blattabacterium cuenoti]
MEYNFRKIEKYWQKYWEKNKIFHVKENEKQKYYILNMFPYPSGYGLHVGHCLGYIASDIYARYKITKGFNVLNPIGFDSFGLPAEQYAIQNRKHPNYIISKNEKKYTNQIKNIGISFDWNRKLKTSDKNYYKWTQWMFIQIFHSWYDKNDNKAKPIQSLIKEFIKNGNYFVNANTSYLCKFDSKKWKKFNDNEKENILQNYRLAYLCKSMVNWCPDLGTVLANEEIKNGKSIRGGYKVYKKQMLQWHIRINAYANRLINGLNYICCSSSLKKSQINWIGKTKKITVFLEVLHSKDKKIIEFTLLHPEKVFGITFAILSINHPYVNNISLSADYKKKVKNYIEKTFYINKKNITGVFTGNYVLNPITKKLIPIYVTNFFNMENSMESMIGIPAHEEKSKLFSEKFGINTIKVIRFCNKKNQKVCYNSDFLNGLPINIAREKIIKILINKKIGELKISYRIRDAVFSRQRYWGEPIPIYLKNKIPKTIPIEKLPVILPEIHNFQPKNGKSALFRAKNWAWDEKNMKIVSNSFIDYKSVFPIETNTMPSWAGSSWYFLRYMDVTNENFFLSKKKENYWKNVDLYIGGSEHNTGHLIYARFWHKFLKDRGWVQTEEPFKKILNQGMILSFSAIILKVIGKNIFVSYGLKEKSKVFHMFQEIYIDIFFIENNNHLNISNLKKIRPEFYNSIFILENGTFLCKRKLEKMSKSKYNIVNPDDIYKKYGADVFRLHEMFLGPIVQSKPWDDKKINGVKKFIKKLFNLFHQNGVFQVLETDPTFEEFHILHYTIKNIEKHIQLFSFNVCISYFMIAINKLLILKCKKRKILEPLIQLLAPFIPHISEELWNKLGKQNSILYHPMPIIDVKYIKKNKITYPIMFNGKFKFLEEFDYNIEKEEIKNKILNNLKTKNILKKNIVKKIIFIPKKIINILF